MNMRKQIRKDSLESDLSEMSGSDLSSLSDLSDLSEPELIERRHSEPAKLDMVRFLVKPGPDKVIIFQYCTIAEIDITSHLVPLTFTRLIIIVQHNSAVFLINCFCTVVISSSPQSQKHKMSFYPLN